VFGIESFVDVVQGPKEAGELQSFVTNQYNPSTSTYTKSFASKHYSETNASNTADSPSPDSCSSFPNTLIWRGVRNCSPRNRTWVPSLFVVLMDSGIVFRGCRRRERRWSSLLLLLLLLLL